MVDLMAHFGAPTWVPRATTAMSSEIASLPADAPRWIAALPRIVDFIGSDVVVAHSAAFDTGVICYACAVDSLEWPALSFLCTLVVARQAFALPSYWLPCVTDALRVTLEGHHNALVDAHAVVVIVRELAASGGMDDLDGFAALHGVRVGAMAAGAFSSSISTFPGRSGSTWLLLRRTPLPTRMGTSTGAPMCSF